MEMAHTAAPLNAESFWWRQHVVSDTATTIPSPLSSPPRPGVFDVLLPGLRLFAF